MRCIVDRSSLGRSGRTALAILQITCGTKPDRLLHVTSARNFLPENDRASPLVAGHGTATQEISDARAAGPRNEIDIFTTGKWNIWIRNSNRRLCLLVPLRL